MNLVKYFCSFVIVAVVSILPGSAAAQTTCGDIIYDYGYGEERQAVIDCNNPFNADSPAPFTYELKLFEQLVTPNAVITVKENEPVTTAFVINKGGNFTFAPLTIFRKEGEDYRRIDFYNYNPPQFSSLSEGEYVAVLVWEEAPIGIVKAEPTWKTFLKNLFLPATALAFYEDYQEVVAIPFSVEYETPEPTGASSVLFLPGIQASRLYMDDNGNENQLWEPNINADVEKLAMTEQGESINDIYTRDVVDEVFGVINVYESFIRFLDGLISDNTINDWKPFAYDWRYDVFDVVEEGTLYRNSVSNQSERIYPIELIESLAASSKSGKVTIVAHSNGGLLAKALMIKLEAEGKADLIDEIIFIGSPQLGTPKAIATILHGYDQSLIGGLLVSDETARRSTRNMPGAYGLLPSSAYVSAAGKPLIQFDDSDSTAQFRSAFGNAINSADELRAFMIGVDGRSDAQTIQDAIIANSNILNSSQNYHNNLLDTWEAPSGVLILEIVGVGRDSEDSFTYKEFSERVCSEPDIFGTQTCTKNTFYKPVPQMTLYGDGTVVGDSAEGYEGEKDIYYLDLVLTKLDLGETIKHSNLTESESIQKFIFNQLSSSTESIPYLSLVKPDLNQDRTMIGVHSPVSLSVIDSEGNKVGLFNGELIEDITGSSYREIAGSKYIIVPKGINYEVSIKGLAEGGLTLTIDELKLDHQVESLHIPIEVITASTSISFNNTNNELSNILVDTNGDGEINLEITPEGEVVNEKEEEEVNYQTLIDKIKDLGLRKTYERKLLLDIKLAEKMAQKSKKKVFKKIENLFLIKLRHSLIVYNNKEIINDSELNELLGIIIKLSN